VSTASVSKRDAERELLLGCATLAIAAGYYLMASRIQQSDIADVIGPQGLPRTYAALLAGLSVILIVRALIRTRTQRIRAGSSVTVGAESPGAASAVSEVRETPRNVGWRVFGMLMNGVIYILVVPWLGYILSIAALIAATVYYQGGGFNRRVAAVAIGGALVLWLLFVRLLHIAHPAGIWG
jgi:hypothetical protein